MSLSDYVKNGDVLHRIEGERYILRTINRRKGKWIEYTLRRNCLVKHVIEGKRRGARRRKHLLDKIMKKILEFKGSNTG